MTPLSVYAPNDAREPDGHGPTRNVNVAANEPLRAAM